jgi:serine/threonine-protein kinase
MAHAKAGDLLAGKYRVDRVIGEGGMGVVVVATHVQLEERYALKFMLPRAMESPEASARFLQEAKAAAKLKSEHVARVHDVGTLESGAPYIVMEYLEGVDLSRILLERGPVSPQEAADYVLQACDAIAEAHARGIIHRDLKPANLFVARGPDGQPVVKVLDFGISKANAFNEGSVSRTRSSVLLGSPLYMSPEQMKSARDVTPATDVWSLGVILYEAVGGRVPYDAGTVGALMAKVLTEEPAPLQAVRSDVPEAFAMVVARCLDREPTRRFEDVGQLARALAPFASPRVQGLAERAVGILAAPPPPPARVSGLEATLADVSGPLPDAGAGAGKRAETAGGWGSTQSGGASRRWMAIAIGVVLALVLTGAAVGVFLAMRWKTVASTALASSAVAAPSAPAGAGSSLATAPPASVVALSAPAAYAAPVASSPLPAVSAMTTAASPSASPASATSATSPAPARPASGAPGPPHTPRPAAPAPPAADTTDAFGPGRR